MLSKGPNPLDRHNSTFRPAAVEDSKDLHELLEASAETLHSLVAAFRG